MQILIDECLDRRLKREFKGHTAMTVTDLGWGGIKNGTLLTLAQSQFDVFVTADKNLQTQQNLANFSIAIVVLRAASTRLQDALPLIPKLMAMMSLLKPGTITFVDP